MQADPGQPLLVEGGISLSARVSAVRIPVYLFHTLPVTHASTADCTGFSEGSPAGGWLSKSAGPAHAGCVAQVFLCCPGRGWQFCILHDCRAVAEG